MRTMSKLLAFSTQSESALRFIYDNILKSGLGAVNKSELEVILFSALMLYSEWKELGDLELSKELGITQGKVRTLREKASLRYLKLTLDEALASFAECVKTAEIDDTGRYLEILVPDIAVQREIEGLLKKQRVLYKKQLNSMVVQLRIDKFVDMVKGSKSFTEAYGSDEKRLVTDLIARRKEFARFSSVKLTSTVERLSTLLGALKSVDIGQLLSVLQIDVADIQAVLRGWVGK